MTWWLSAFTLILVVQGLHELYIFQFGYAISSFFQKGGRLTIAGDSSTKRFFSVNAVHCCVLPLWYKCKLHVTDPYVHTNKLTWTPDNLSSSCSISNAKQWDIKQTRCSDITHWEECLWGPSVSQPTRTHLPDSNDCVGHQNEQDDNRLHESCGRLLPILKQCQHLMNKHNINYSYLIFKAQFCSGYWSEN